MGKLRRPDFASVRPVPGAWSPPRGSTTVLKRHDLSGKNRRSVWLLEQGALHRKKGGEGRADANTAAGKGIGPNFCDRGKMGVKQSGRPLGIVEGSGYPLAVCIAGANLNDHSLLAATLDAIVVERPEPSEGMLQHLCLDKSYDNAPTRNVVAARGYTEHIRRIGEEKKDGQGENDLAWVSRALG